jgi:hypothetical protein
MSHHPYPLPPASPWPQPAHGSPLHALSHYLPDLGARGFWMGAAIGAAAVLLLKSRVAAAPRPDADLPPSTQA